MTSGLWPLQSVGQLGHRFGQTRIQMLSTTCSIPGDNLASYEQSGHYDGERKAVGWKISISVELGPNLFDGNRKPLSTWGLACWQRGCHGMSQFLSWILPYYSAVTGHSFWFRLRGSLLIWTWCLLLGWSRHTSPLNFFPKTFSTLARSSSLPGIWKEKNPSNQYLRSWR